MPRSRCIPAPITDSHFRSGRFTIATPPSGTGNGCWRSIAAISRHKHRRTQMRFLAFSDIHHNLVAVRKLRALEKNSFDAIVVAGDIGNESAADFFKILATFKCPVMYVYGNWDNKLGYKTSFGHHCHLIHANVITIGNISFTGFSGCPTHWGKNPIARKFYRQIEAENKSVLDALRSGAKPQHRIRRTKAYQKYATQLQSARNEILKLNRENLGKVVKNAEIDPRKCVVITHQRLAR